MDKTYSILFFFITKLFAFGCPSWQPGVWWIREKSERKVFNMKVHSWWHNKGCSQQVKNPRLGKPIGRTSASFLFPGEGCCKVTVRHRESLGHRYPDVSWNKGFWYGTGGNPTNIFSMNYDQPVVQLQQTLIWINCAWVNFAVQRILWVPIADNTVSYPLNVHFTQVHSN